MIRRFLSILFLGLSFGFAEAQTSSLYLSYCDGKLAETGASRMGVDVTISAAVGFPAATLAQYSGARLTTLRLGLCTTNSDMSDMTAWVRNSLTGDILAEVRMEDFKTGWNDVTLEAPITIDGTNDLYLGFSYKQSRSVKCLSFVGETHPMGAWIGRDDSWEDYSTRDMGSLSIEGIIEGEGLPQYDLNVLDMKLLSGEIVRDEGLPFEATVKNVASQPISGLLIDYSLGDGAKTGQISIAQTLNPRDEVTVAWEVPTKDVPAGTCIPADITVLLPDGSADEDMTNNSFHFDYATYEAGTDFEHIALFEEFTTEKCVNCPSATQRIEAALEKGYFDKVILATHHAGYYTDWLTIEADREYCWFYNDGGSTYAPASMLDRTLTGMDKDFSPVFNPPQSAKLCERFDIALARPALVGVNTSLQYDKDSRQVTISVEGQRLDAFEHQCQEPRITVFALIDSIQAKDQTGAGEGYYHRHVTRAVLTDVWGDVLTWNDDNTFSNTYTWIIPEEYREEKFEAVAFVSNYDANDPTNCCIFNSSYSELGSQLVAAIETIHADNNKTSSCFNLMGQRCDDHSHGFIVIDGKLFLR